MAEAERIAIDRQCEGIWLDTFSFQAPGFYAKLGFERFGLIKDFPPGQSRHFLMKRLI
jgi:ribosomal protein S18 acetylase RimI-like enzyme